MRRIHYAWLVAAVGLFTLVTSAGFRSTTGVLIVPLQDEFGWSRATIGFAVAINLVVFGLGGPFAAAFVERYGMRRVITVAVLGISAGFWEREFAFRGLSFAARGTRFADLIGTLQAALAGEAHAGDLVSLPEGGGRVSPIPPTGGVPIWLAGARATFERALQLGLPFQASRSSPDELAPLAREWFDRGGGTLAVRIRLTVEEAPGGTPGETVEWNTIGGSTEHALDQLQRYIELGVTDISIVPGQDDRVSLSTVEALGTEVIPKLARHR